MKKILFFFLSLMFTGWLMGQTPVRVACVGNSITENKGVEEGKKYPDILQTLLGNDYQVRNYGIGGRTLLKKGDFPYWNEKRYQEVLAWQPNIVIIKLGTNDTKPQNWKYKDEFISNYREFIKSFKNLPSKPTIYVCLPIPVFEDKWGITENVLKNEAIPLIKKAARHQGVKVIDLYHPLLGKKELVYDGIHPNADGTKVMAEVIYSKIKK